MNRTTPEALEMIKHFEGLRLEAYQCSAEKWTIGYGTTHTALGAVKPGQRITKAEAERLFESDIRLFEQRVRDLVEVPLTDNQFSALVSFAYNLGEGALKRSTLLRKLNNSDFSGAADEFPKWKYAGGKEELGLVRRRAAERRMFVGRDWKEPTQ